MRCTLGDAPIVAINTGYHVDSLGGNDALLEAKIPIVGTTLTARLLEERGERTRVQVLEWLAGEEMPPFREAHQAIHFSPPNRLVSLQADQSYRFEDGPVELYILGQPLAVRR